MRRAARVLTAVLFALFNTQCAGDASQRRVLLVAAASDLAVVMPALRAAFERETGIPVEVTLASSGQLAQQIQQGAPIDVFLSADRDWVERLARAGKLVTGTMTPYAYGQLVVVTKKNTQTPRIEQLGDAATGRIAIANPEHAPYGRAAGEALEAAGVLGAIGTRLIIAENVRQTIQLVESGAVDAAISALSLVRPEAHSWTPVPQELYTPLVQTAAVIADQPHTTQAEWFMRFLLGDGGRAILGQHAFALPDPS